MSLMLNDFGNLSKWIEYVEGTGIVLNRERDTFQISVSQLDDIAGLIAVNPINLIGQDLSIITDVVSARSGILLSPSSIPNTFDNFTYFFVRDSNRGEVQVWLGGRIGFISDPVPVNQPAELRITIVSDPNFPNGLINFFYEGILLHQEEIRSWINPTLQYVYIFGTGRSVNVEIIGTNTFQTSGFVPPTAPQHLLTISSNPVLGIPFQLRGGDGELSLETSWTGTIEERIWEVEMESNVLIGSDTHNFVQWENGSTNPIRSVNLLQDSIINATYQLATLPPPLKGTINVNAFVASSPVIADILIVETTQQLQTPISILVDPGFYTIEATFNQITKFETLNINEGETLRVDFDFTPAPISPSSLLIPALIAGVILLKDKR